MSYSEDILEILFQERRWMSTTEIAKKVDCSWNTAQDYLEDLHKDEYILYRKVGNRDLWKFNFIKWKMMREK